jgi:transcriptional regulator with XRE-family HTH domain
MSKVHIGKEIKDRVKKRDISAETLAKLLNVSKPNIYKIYLRSSIDTELLERISVVLEFNFFELYSPVINNNLKKDAYDSCLREVELLNLLVKEKEEKYQILISKLKK